MCCKPCTIWTVIYMVDSWLVEGTKVVDTSVPFSFALVSFFPEFTTHLNHWLREVSLIILAITPVFLYVWNSITVAIAMTDDWVRYDGYFWRTCSQNITAGDVNFLHSPWKLIDYFHASDLQSLGSPTHGHTLTIHCLAFQGCIC